LLLWVYHATTTTIDPKIGRDQGGLGCFGSSQEMKVRPLISISSKACIIFLMELHALKKTIV